jgi:hypothetical protein
MTLHMATREPTGLGSEYERFVLSDRTRRSGEPLRTRTVRTLYALVSWLLSLTLLLILPFVAFGVAHAFLRSSLALAPFLVTFIALCALWGRSWKRHRAHLVRLVPRSDYRRFTEWEARQRGGKLTPPGARRWRLDFRLVKRIES